MSNGKRLILCIFALLVKMTAIAQNNSLATEETSILRSEGKIYVVMVVVITILAGLLLYVLRLDRKITRLEKDIHND